MLVKGAIFLKTRISNKFKGKREEINDWIIEAKGEPQKKSEAPCKRAPLREVIPLKDYLVTTKRLLKVTPSFVVNSMR